MTFEIRCTARPDCPLAERFFENARKSCLELGLESFITYDKSGNDLGSTQISVFFKGMSTDLARNIIRYGNILMFLENSRGFCFYKKLEEAR